MSPIRPENRARYPKNWRQISDEIRFERAGGQCECDGRCGSGCCEIYALGRSPLTRCPLRHGKESRTGATVVLTVAHLDHIPENCDPENLRAMCQACHLNYDRAHHAETARATRAAALAAQMEPMF